MGTLCCQQSPASESQMPVIRLLFGGGDRIGGRQLSVEEYLQGGLGLLVLCFLAWAVSENRRVMPLRPIVAGLGLQFALAIILLKIGVIRGAFENINSAVDGLQTATNAGTSFVFGYLGGANFPFEETGPGSSLILAFSVLPLILVVSALTAVLTYWKILPLIVRCFAGLLERPFGVSGAAGLGTAANIFVGMVEAPLFIRDYLNTMSRADLFVVMCGGMATIAGTMLVLYSTILADTVPNAASHLLIASIISAPAAVMIARIMIPGDAGQGHSVTGEQHLYTSTMDAVTDGTRSGLNLYLNIIAMLLVLVALVQIVNSLLGLLPDAAGIPITLERLFGWLMAPVAWLMGIPWKEAVAAGSILGTKTVLNEFLAYVQLAAVPDGDFSVRTRLILTYALCGFANFGSLGIMIGGLSTLAPDRRKEIVGLGMRSIVGGTLATCCTGGIVGLIGG